MTDGEYQKRGQGEPIGQLLDQRGVRATLGEGDLASDALVVLATDTPWGGG